MQLRQIKLAGFKSFVDPTQIDVPGRLVGVVGPNGCGKSNVIDAVRWVLGESKAAELRGESMQDVIFNGAASRATAGRASVELLFDNSEGRIGGEWGRFSELSVKRILTRDGASSYLINQQHVRRRDVHDLFLGTGVGPRAYAIIGQGMISRIVEARPEELRVYLEEAAGVSKYKERRRETEARLRDARDNLARVGDILRELDERVVHLEQQAELARQYRELTRQHTDSQMMLWLLRSRDAHAQRQRCAREVEQAEAAIEAHRAELSALQRTLEEDRSAHFAAGDQTHAAQGELLRVNAEIGHLEGEIRMISDSRARLSGQIAGYLQRQEQRTQEQARLAQRLSELNASISQYGTDHERACAASGEHDGQLPGLETAYHAAREALTEARSSAAGAAQAIEGAAQHARTLDDQLAALAQRSERLSEERAQQESLDQERLGALHQQVEQLDRELQERVRGARAAEEQQVELETERGAASQEKGEAADLLARMQARVHALSDLQANVEADERLDPWLKTHGVDSLPRLFKRLEVESGWEAAFEAVLRERIEAIEVGNLDTLAAFESAAPPSRVAFFTVGAGSETQPPPALWPPLAGKLRDADSALAGVIRDWLAGVYVAPDLRSALQQRHQLPAGTQLVVRSGHRISRHGVRFYAADDRKAGLLLRRLEIENLQRQLKAQRLIEEAAVARLARAESGLRRAQELAQSEREAVERLRIRSHEGQLEAVRLGESQERIRLRREQIDAELAEIGAHRRALEQQRSDAHTRFEDLDQALGTQQQQVETARVEYETAEKNLREGRESSHRLQAERQRLQIEINVARERLAESEGAMRDAVEECERLAKDLEQARLEEARLDDSSARGNLEQSLQQRVSAEQTLRDARTRQDEVADRVRSGDERRLTLERDLQPRIDRATDLKLKEQAARLAAEQFDTQLAEAGADMEALAARIERGTSASSLQAEITRLAQAIEALGAVNLAALEELEAARQRREFLQSQSSDLKAAITTLEDAIRKIDRETREMLRSTFDQVNRHFGELFPRLFGGGDARLLMTGEEILDAGVQVMAQPPGKRNSTIHLLSGGEKAMTATALVFSLFKLNPAPFCLLDEVDAPLDEANTERFCDLVRSMTGETQFLFITHNKIAMEMAEQLVGVTMQEQGVSRIVAVDIDSAVKLAAAEAA
ncbi:MAG TPA: chromosome segregation protein SMC [Burkholderiaceae bacterium]